MHVSNKMVCLLSSRPSRRPSCLVGSGLSSADDRIVVRGRRRGWLAARCAPQPKKKASFLKANLNGKGEFLRAPALNGKHIHARTRQVWPHFKKFVPAIVNGALGSNTLEELQTDIVMPTMEEAYQHRGNLPLENMTTISNHCAGCSAVDVALLTCDDIDGSGNVADPSQRARFCANCMIGKKVRVFWPVDSQWYIGTVQEYDTNTGEHLLQYDDNDTEWVKIGESNTTAPPNTGPAITRSSGTPGRPPQEAADSALPVSPARHPSEGEHPHNYPSVHYYPGQQPSVTPDERDGGAPRRSQAPPGYYGSPYPPPPPSYHGYPSYGPPQGAYGYAPPSLYPPHMSPEGKDQSGSPSSSRKKQGPKAWTKEEDSLLLSIVQNMRMPMKWSVVAQSLTDRTGKQCRERYVNHLNPRLKNTDWSPVEDATIFHLYDTIGSHWAKMSKMIPGRTDNGIKNRFHNLRRQLEREDEHRTRLSSARDFPEEIRLDRIRDFPEKDQGRSADLWDMKAGLSVLAAQSTLGNGISRSAGRFGPFRAATSDDVCIRCGFILPSLQTGREICTKTGWCQSCTRVAPHVSGMVLRECLNLRRSQDPEQRTLMESWAEPSSKAATKS